MQAAILVGGLGTRLRPLTETVPKPMVTVAGKPFLEHEIELLRRSGIVRFVLCTGHLGDQVERHFRDGSRWGVEVKYSRDGPSLLGPAGALRKARPLLEERFFVTYGDAYLKMDYGALMRSLIACGRLGVMAVYKNHGRYGKSDVDVRDGMVVRYDKGERATGMEWVNFGVSALRRAALDLIPEGRACGEEEFYGALIRKGELAAYPVERRFYEIGTPASLAEAERFVERERRAPRRRT